MDKMINIEPPDGCECGFKPVIPNNVGQEVAVEHTWIVFNIPGMVVWLFICPKCGKIMPNKNFVDCVKKLKEIHKSRIFVPNGVKSVLQLAKH